jgi:hypothetical protein
VKHLSEKDSLTPQQIFGNWLANVLIRIIFGEKFTDLRPFRAKKYLQLLKLNMEDKTFGWTVKNAT